MTLGHTEPTAGHTLSDEEYERASMVFATIGKGIHPDEGLAALADLLDIEYRPKWWGKELRFEPEQIWARIEREWRRINA